MPFATSTLSLFLYGEAYPRPTASGCRRHPASARDASPSTSGGERPMWFRSFLLGALGYNILFAFPELAFLSRTPRKSRTRVGTGKGGFRIPNVPCSFCERRTSDKKSKATSREEQNRAREKNSSGPNDPRHRPLGSGNLLWPIFNSIIGRVMALLRRLAVTLTERAARQHCEEGQKKRERKKGEKREKRMAQNEEDAPGKKKETSEREKQIQFLSAPRQCCARNLLVALP